MWTLIRRLARAARGLAISGGYREYMADLPDGFGAKQITIRVSQPPLPSRPIFSFSEHVMDEAGCPTDMLMAVVKCGFAISKDLGRSWKRVRILVRETHPFVHAKWIGKSELLLQS